MMIALVIICIACAAYLLWKQYNTRSDEPPLLSGCYPVFGHLLTVIGNSCKLWETLNKYAEQSYSLGGVVTARVGPRTLYVVTDPDDVVTVANTCLEKDDFYDFVKPWLGEGLITGKMSIWKKHRKILNPAFSQVVLDRFMGVFNSQSRKLVDALDKEVGRGYFDQWMYTRSSALETICCTRFKPFMDLLLELSLEKGLLNDKEVREHVDTMIVSGYETSANAIMFTMLLLGAYPYVQEKVFAELKEVLGDGDRDVEKQDLSKLLYLEAVIKESMRIHTVVPIIARKLDKDVKLKNYTLLAGRTCFLLLFGLHRHPIWGPDRNEFSPERWLDPNRLPKNPDAFAAFSWGRRMCIGKNYVMTSMKTTLAHIVRKYRITADDSQLLLKIDILLKPVHGHLIRIERRTSQGFLSSH